MPAVPIDRHALDNGLRVFLSPDDRAPIVAVNLWYDVGVGNEKAGRTGFAHLFEHMMFQGSAHVAEGEHFDARRSAPAARSTASTWLDRTNYFETLPSHELELALWLEADRMGILLPAMTQEKLDNQRDVVKNERRWSVDNQPYGDWDERCRRWSIPPTHPVSPPAHRLDGGPRRRIAGRRPHVLRDLLRARTTRSSPSPATSSPSAALRHGRPPLRLDPGQRGPARSSGGRGRAADWRGGAGHAPRPRAAAAHLSRAPRAGLRDPGVRCAQVAADLLGLGAPRGCTARSSASSAWPRT